MQPYDEDYLEHDFTPSELSKINAQIIQLLNTESFDIELDSERLLQLVTLRDEFILSYLEQLSEQAELKQSFVQAEVPVNQALLLTCQALLKNTKNQLTHLMKSQKAIKKYK